MPFSFLLLVALFFLGAASSVRCDERTSPLPEAIRRGVAYVEKEGIAWIKERNCVSCHQIPAMLWTLNEAHKRGFYKHAKKLADWTEWSLQWQHWNTPKADQTEASVAVGNIDTMTSLILSYPGSLPAASDEETIARYVDHIVSFQNKDGSWKPGGQLPLQKRPKEESGQVTTMWTVLALDAAGVDTGAVQKARRRALKYIADQPPGKSTEWWVTRWLIERRDGDKSKADDLLAKLIALQHEDGGWGWLHTEASDAFGSGIALYALGQSGLTSGHPAVDRAHRYLLRTQLEDGSWPVKSTLARHQKRLLPTSQHWGTAWAALGLMSTMRAP